MSEYMLRNSIDLRDFAQYLVDTGFIKNRITVQEMLDGYKYSLVEKLVGDRFVIDGDVLAPFGGGYNREQVYLDRLTGNRMTAYAVHSNKDFAEWANAKNKIERS